MRNSPRNPLRAATRKRQAMGSEKKDDAAEKPLTSAMEDYLEAIYELDRDRKVVRVKDIARRMDVKMPSVSNMLKTLSRRGLVQYEKYEYVELTRDGADVGREMRRRHRVLREFLTEILKIEFRTADEEACRMEHALSSETLDSLVDFMAFIRNCPRAGDSWLRFFEEYRLRGRIPEKCAEHGDDFVCEFRDRIEGPKSFEP
jgi:DtxR family transcriptional regulator, Mn-dependent transcriptional regulator